MRAWIDLRHLSRKVWLRAALFSLAGLVTALGAAFVSAKLPGNYGVALAAESVRGLLDMMAASMLTVTTFSLATVTAAYQSAATAATPRAAALLIGDSGVNNTLGTFVGAFLFSVVGLVGLSAKIYSDAGQVVLFAATIVVIVLVVVRLLAWIQELTNFGMMANTISRVERAATKALIDRARAPRLGGVDVSDIPHTLRQSTVGGPQIVTSADRVGYVTALDVEALQQLAVRSGGWVEVHVEIGEVVHRGQHLLTLHLPDSPDSPGSRASAAAASARSKDERHRGLDGAVLVRSQRDFDTDPRFGLVVLSEIASRALSPAVNDPGTAINVITAGARALEKAASTTPAPATHDRVAFTHLDTDDLLQDLFAPICRDGASTTEVQIMVQKALRALSQHSGFREAAIRRSALAMQDAALASNHDQQRLRAAAAWRDTSEL